MLSSPPRYILVRCGIAVLSGSLLSGCASFEKNPASESADHAFIQYWGRPENSGRLRVAVKDLIDMKGEVTTAGSEYLAKNSPPAKQDAACLSNARRRNVHFVGKTNLTEFAISVSGINDYYGMPHNPLSDFRRRIPGGSSSGSAVAVASGAADIAIGTDTAGSIRIPAAFCGIVGLKTTHKAISLKGVYPISPEYLDTVGPMGKDISSTVQGMDLLQPGFAARYERLRSANSSPARIRVGRVYLPGTAREVDRAVDRALMVAGFEVVQLGDDFRDAWKEADRDGRTIAAVGAWINSGRYTQLTGVSARTKAVVTLGRIEYTTRYKEALAGRLRWKDVLARTLHRVDFVALPTAQRLTPALPLIGGSPAFEARVFAMQNTVAVNLAGNPAVAVPIPADSNSVPLTSIQLIGRPSSEAELLNAGRVIEETSRRGLAVTTTATRD
jgi:amidase